MSFAFTSVVFFIESLQMKKNNMGYTVRGFCVSKPTFLRSSFLKTTLYEVIEAVNEEINPGEEHLVFLIVDHMLFAGRMIQSDKKHNILSTYREKCHG